MPLAIRCDCGRQLRVADEHAGKRVKCPGCGGTVTVPDPEATTRTSGPPKVRFTCACGKVMLAKPEYTGRATRCPDCGKTLTIPGGESDGRAEAAQIRKGKPAPRREAPPPEEDWDEEDERPARRKRKAEKGSNLPLLLVLGAVLLLLVVGGVAGAVWWLWTEKPVTPSPSLAMAPVDREPRDVELVAEDAQILMGVRLADLLQNEAVKRLYDKMAPAGGGGVPAPAIQSPFGLRPEEIARSLGVILDPNEGLAYGVVTTAVGYDQQRVLAQIPGAAPRQHAGQTYYAGAGPPGRSQAVFFAGKTVLVIGPEAAVQTGMTALSEKRTATGLVTDLERLLQDNQVALVSKGALPPAAKQEMLQKLPALRAAEAALDFTKLTTAVAVDTALTIRLGASYPDEPKARQAKSQIDALKALAGFSMFAVEGQLKQAGVPEAEAKEIVGQATKFLNGIQVTQQGTAVTATGSVDVKTVEKLIESLLRQAQPGGPRVPGR